MGKFKDLTGQTFGGWSVLERTDNAKNGNAQFLCECKCGELKTVRSSHLIAGKTTSCGCNWTTHNKSKTPIYRVWDSMVRRCNNESHHAYDSYGARGIEVCTKWSSFSGFYEDMGDAPKGMSLDRIDNNKGYSKDNCRWATKTEQARNTRSTKLTVNMVKDIKMKLKHGLSQSAVAEMFNCSRGNIGHIAQGTIWKEVA